TNFDFRTLYKIEYESVDPEEAKRLFTTITVNEPALGLKTIFNFRVPDQRSEKFFLLAELCPHLQYQPEIFVSDVVGTDVLAIGSKLSYDIKIGEFTKYNAGVNFTKADLVASLTIASAICVVQL
ncbi:hypothetical protein S245_033060, partial [Arachis hypogaea]